MPELAASPVAPAAGGAPTGFDRVAWCYDALVALVFGPALRRAQRAALVGLPPEAPHVLILGGGTGWVLGEVLRRSPRATVLYLEASGRMLARARARLAREHPAAAGQVTFRHGTQANLAPEESFDTLITFFVLDCLAAADVGPALRRLRTSQRPGAPWLLADFRPAERGWRRVLLALMYGFFRFATGLQARKLPLLRRALGQLGLRPTRRRLFFGGAIEAAVFIENSRPATVQKIII